MSASLSRLQSFYGDLKAPLLLHAVIKREFPGTVAVLTSFAPDCSVLLAMAAEIDPSTPVLFLGDGEGHAEIADYGKNLCAQLGLKRLHTASLDGKPDALADWLDTMGILAVITDRRDASLPRVELDEGGVFRIHPLAGWPEEALKNEALKRNLPAHPLDSATGAQPLAATGNEPDAPAVIPVDWSV